MSRLTLATNSAAFEQRVRRALGSVNGDLRRWRGSLTDPEARTVVLDLTADDTDVVAFGPDLVVADALAIAREVDEARPDISVIVVTEPSPDLWEAALHAGVREVLPADVSDDELRVGLERALEITDRRRRAMPTTTVGTGPAGRVISVVAPKGGSGKTAIATNLGVGLAHAAPGEVAIVDLDLQFGDITSTLELNPEHTMADVTRASGPVDSTALKVFLTARQENLFVLCAPNSPADGEIVSEQVVRRTIELLAEQFPYVIVDTSAGLSEHTLAALEMSTDLILVCDMSVAAVRGMRKVIDALDRLELTDAQRYFILNRADSRVGVELADVAATLGRSVDLRLPSSRAVATAMNAGVPLIETAPRSAYGKRIGELIGLLVPEAAPRETRFRRRRSE